MSVRSSVALVLATALAVAGVARARAADPLGTGPGAIVARVRDPAGQPVDGALVDAEGPAARTATTTIGGVVTLLDLPLGTYDVRVTRNGYEPAETRVRVGRDTTLHVTELRVVLAGFGNLSGRAGTSTLHRSASIGDPTPARELATASSITVVRASPTSAGGAATLIGTGANETRYELDGIPIPGGAAGAAAFAARDALGLDAIELARGPVAGGSTPRGAIGGVVDERTFAPGGPDGASVAAGYASSFGSFEEYRLARRRQRLSVAFDLTAGDGRSRAQTFKAEYDVSKTTSIAVASYGLQANEPVRGGGYLLSAPAASADVRTRAGGAQLHVRGYTTSSSASAYGPAATSPLPAAGISALANDALLANERLAGTQGDLSVPFGASRATASFDRQSDVAELASGATVRRSFTTDTLNADVALASDARLALAEAFSSGSSLAPRADPQATLSIRAAAETTLRASAGSSFAAAPPQTVAALRDPAALAPETAFGYRFDVEQQMTPDSRFFGDAYTIRARDRFAALSDARYSGVEVGYDADPAPGRVTFSGYLDLERSIAFGSAQPAPRYADAPETAGALANDAELPGDPYAKARVAATYRDAGGAELSVASTAFGADNAFSASGVTLTDASLFLPFDPFELRLGFSNVFGAPIEPPGLVPAFAPHQVTLSVRRLFGGGP